VWRTYWPKLCLPWDLLLQGNEMEHSSHEGKSIEINKKSEKRSINKYINKGHNLHILVYLNKWVDEKIPTWHNQITYLSPEWQNQGKLPMPCDTCARLACITGQYEIPSGDVINRHKKPKLEAYKCMSLNKKIVVFMQAHGRLLKVGEGKNTALWLIRARRWPVAKWLARSHPAPK
jgi:hypothetical protein